MKVKPAARLMRTDEERKEDLRLLTERICRVIAIIVALASTYGLFFKILYF